MSIKSLMPILFSISISSYAAAITGVNPTPHPPINKLPLSMAHRINLEQAIDMVLKTDLGRQLKPDIAELAGQGKIRLMPLNEKHYGESGEGCVIRDGKYVYEGAFILLNDKQSVPELASSLVHETDHYRQIKRINSEKPAEPVKIGWLEVSAFATQSQFIDELESLGLANHQTMFVDSGEQVFGIMSKARQVGDNRSGQAYNATMSRMMEFGYPHNELERTLVVNDREHCIGAVAAKGYVDIIVEKLSAFLNR